MSSSFLFGISITLFVLILSIESVYNPYLYDDGHGGQEHCCVVRVRKDFCLATPITRSLIQVNKQCGRHRRSKNHRFGRKNRQNEYFDKISRRINVQKVHEDNDKIFIELQKPLEKNILQNDLICLTSTNNNNTNTINFEQCYVELVDELYGNHVPHREHRRRKHRGRHQDFDQIERSILKSEEVPAINNDDDESDEEQEAKLETNRIEISHPIRVREGHGLSFLQQYQLTPSNIRPKTRYQRQCWSWYRDQTRKIRQNPKKSFKSCIPLNDAREKCINQLIDYTFNDDQKSKHSFSIGSKLFCKNHAKHDKFLGYYHHGEICFDQKDQIHIEYKFSDIARLSDLYKNKDILEFISNNDKLTAEFEDDCHGKTNLVETIESEKATTKKSAKKN